MQFVNARDELPRTTSMPPEGQAQVGHVPPARPDRIGAAPNAVRQRQGHVESVPVGWPVGLMMVAAGVGSAPDLHDLRLVERVHALDPAYFTPNGRTLGLEARAATSRPSPAVDSSQDSGRDGERLRRVVLVAFDLSGAEDLGPNANDQAYRALDRIHASREAPAVMGVETLEGDEARLLMRLITRSLETSRSQGPRLAIGPKAVWLECPGAPRKSLEKYAAVRNILDALTRERLAHPGRALSLEALFAAGWPGVKIALHSANNRLYVALAKLRKAGLKPFLKRTPEGYFLDPDTPVVRAAA